MISLWPKAEADKLYISLYMLEDFSCLSDYAESLELIACGVFLFRVIEYCMSALAKRLDNIDLHAVIQECRFELILQPPQFT